MMNDLCKCTLVDGQPRFKALALTDNVPLLTAVANDVEYAEVFVEPLRTHLGKGDVVVALSGSGQSPNILRAVAFAKEQGAVTIGLCGMPGGMLAKLADLRVIVPAERIGQQEDGHLIVSHAIVLALRERIEAYAARLVPARHRPVRRRIASTACVTSSRAVPVSSAAIWSTV